MKKIKYEGIVKCSNEDYHAEKEHLSSSNLKTLLKSPEQFYEEKILGNKAEHSTSTQNNFNEGTLTHSMILEPHLVEDEFKFFQGFRKHGKDWEAFKNKYKDNNFILMSKSQKMKVEKWVKCFYKNPMAKKFVEGGDPELTLFGELMGVPVKVRADYCSLNGSFVSDVKTTSYPTDLDSFSYTVQNFEYDLSAALYLMMFEKHYNTKLFFYFLVIGKTDNSCEVYKLSEKTRKVGEAKVIKALQLYKKCKKSGIWSLSNNKKSDNLENGEYEILEV